MITEPLFDSYRINCEVIPMGNDYTVVVYGGDTPHAGSVVMSIARPSLTRDGISVTSSVMNKLGHKDEVIARLFAETVAREKNCTAICSCGIHIDDITQDQLIIVQNTCNKILKKLLCAIM